MDFLTGSQAIKTLRTIELYNKIKNKIKVISVAAFEDIETKNEFLQSGVDIILSKPL
jgi:response regulator RpfG family c-di-GMP phosphodiesterase